MISPDLKKTARLRHGIFIRAVVILIFVGCVARASLFPTNLFINGFTGQPDTNKIAVFTLDPFVPVLASGQVQTHGGLPLSWWQTNGPLFLPVGNYLFTNGVLGRGIVMRAPDSSSNQNYILQSGFNTFVTVVITNIIGGGGGSATNVPSVTSSNASVVIGLSRAANGASNYDLSVSTAYDAAGAARAATNFIAGPAIVGTIPQAVLPTSVITNNTDFPFTNNAGVFFTSPGSGYRDGLLLVSSVLNTGFVGLGDWADDNGGTGITIDDQAESINILSDQTILIQGGTSVTELGPLYLGGNVSIGSAYHLAGNLSGATNLPVTGIAATGTPNNGTYLRGDGAWGSPSGSGNGNALTNNSGPQNWSGVQNLTNSGNTISGNGGALTNLNAYQLTYLSALFGPQVFYIYADVQEGTNAFMAAGSVDLYITNSLISFYPTNVGEIGEVINGVSNNISLSFTITNWVDAHHVQITPAASNTVLNTPFWLGHDNTAQTQGDSYQMTNGNVTIVAPFGLLIGGQLQDIGGKNAQIILPDISQTNYGIWAPTITFVGQSSIAETFVNANGTSAWQSNRWANYGSTIFSTQGSNTTQITGGAMFNARSDTASPLGNAFWNNVRVQFINLNIQLPPNPCLSAVLDGWALSGDNAFNIGIHTGYSEYGTPTFPLWTIPTFGWQRPFINNAGGGVSDANQFFIFGFGIGLDLSEHDDVDTGCSESCAVGIQFEKSNFPINIKHYNGTFNVTNYLVYSNCSVIVSQNLEAEHDTSTTKWDWYDPSGFATNTDYKWYSVKGGIAGPQHLWMMLEPNSDTINIRELGAPEPLQVSSFPSVTNALTLDGKLHRLYATTSCAITNVITSPAGYGALRIYNISAGTITCAITATGLSISSTSTNLITILPGKSALTSAWSSLDAIDLVTENSQ